MRTICVVTGTRADYGLLFWLMKEIQEDADLHLQVVATGMHLSPEFGLTYKTIEKDLLPIDEKVEMLLSGDTPSAIAKSIGLATIGFADTFARLRPDLLVVLGDRYEILAAAQAAMVARIPIAHLHGGEATEGLIDESIRHSVTKMSHLHFVSAETYRARVIQLGESPDRVFNYGALGLDNLRRLNLLDRNETERELGFKFAKRNFLVTYHPVTLLKDGPEKGFRALLKALDDFPEANLIFTRQNSDTEGRLIGHLIDEYVAKNPGRSMVATSLGQLNYLSVLKHVDLIVGNSSSGIIEAPAMKKGTVNIGKRQQGRIRAPSIVDCQEDAESIATAIRQALSVEFRKALTDVSVPYGDGNAGRRIKEKLKSVDLEGILIKRFYDLHAQ